MDSIVPDRWQIFELMPEYLCGLLLAGQMLCSHGRLYYRLSATAQQFFGTYLGVLLNGGPDGIFAAGKHNQLIYKRIPARHPYRLGLDYPQNFDPAGCAKQRLQIANSIFCGLDKLIGPLSAPGGGADLLNCGKKLVDLIYFHSQDVNPEPAQSICDRLLLAKRQGDDQIRPGGYDRFGTGLPECPNLVYVGCLRRIIAVAGYRDDLPFQPQCK
jgi:hypothetical protein